MIGRLSSIIFHPSSFLAMNRSFSLRRGADFQRVWDDGKSFSHPLVILRARANGMASCRFGFVAGKKNWQGGGAQSRETLDAGEHPPALADDRARLGFDLDRAQRRGAARVQRNGCRD